MTDQELNNEMAKWVSRKLLVIMFEHEFYPIGPFESWQAADEYGMQFVEPMLCHGCNEWKVRPLMPPPDILKGAA
jgi:hypothetical protein